MSSVLCLYGSVTGKAQSIAEQIVQQGTSRGIEVVAYSLCRSLGEIQLNTTMSLAHVFLDLFVVSG